MSLNESHVEESALSWFHELGYTIGHGPHPAPEEPEAERDSFADVVLIERLRDAIWRLNEAIPEEAREDAIRKVLRVATTSLIQTNRTFNRMLRDGVDVEYSRPDGSIKRDKVRLFYSCRVAKARHKHLVRSVPGRSPRLEAQNVAAELLEKLLKDQLKLRSKHNLVQSQLFSEKLEKTLNAYHNRAVATQEVIEELINLAKPLYASSNATRFDDKAKAKSSIRLTK